MATGRWARPGGRPREAAGGPSSAAAESSADISSCRQRRPTDCPGPRAVRSKLQRCRAKHSTIRHSTGVNDVNPSMNTDPHLIERRPQAAITPRPLLRDHPVLRRCRRRPRRAPHRPPASPPAARRSATRNCSGVIPSSPPRPGTRLLRRGSRRVSATRRKYGIRPCRANSAATSSSRSRRSGARSASLGKIDCGNRCQRETLGRRTGRPVAARSRKASSAAGSDGESQRAAPGSPTTLRYSAKRAAVCSGAGRTGYDVGRFAGKPAPETAAGRSDRTGRLTVSRFVPNVTARTRTPSC